jgi:amino acid permease
LLPRANRYTYKQPQKFVHILRFFSAFIFHSLKIIHGQFSSVLGEEEDPLHGGNIMAEHAASIRANHEQPHKLERTLKRRHLEFIALGGALGSGLFLGSGLAIHTAGPSIILVYAFIGLFTFLVMRAMGEILLSNLSYKSFADFANDVVGSWAGFYVGWTYWMVWVIIAISDVIAITAYLEV